MSGSGWSYINPAFLAIPMTSRMAYSSIKKNSSMKRPLSQSQVFIVVELVCLSPALSWIGFKKPSSDDTCCGVARLIVEPSLHNVGLSALQCLCDAAFPAELRQFCPPLKFGDRCDAEVIAEAWFHDANLRFAPKLVSYE
ncbi:hypothetical protein HAX54_019993 [Datura stramonium]|uniref:Uncharacterized protein n=1 Tax=Datura stramonium TaxID=4076 RepID=A0ABS8S2D5_DATST|nr:hypothetical protein [Datura stramonium]